MTDPWAIPPFPTSGDERDSITYEAVGRVLTQWECIEFELANSYATMTEERYGMAMRAYGAGKIFRDRLNLLRRAAEVFFRAHPDQVAEGSFDRLTAVAEGFSARRNDVAHGMVFDVAGLTFFREKLTTANLATPQFLLIPPFYAMREHGDDGLPLYGYTAAMMTELHRDLTVLWMDLDRLNHMLQAL